MIVYEESFADANALERDWISAPGISIEGGVLDFSPSRSEGFCAAVTRRRDFGDLSLAVDVRIVRAAAGVVLRAAGPDRYYMIQFDLANDPSIVWFHTFTPDLEDGYRLARVPAAHVPEPGSWHRLSVLARGDLFEVSLGKIDGPLRHCASWRDPEHTYEQGAIGFWEHGGEAAQYRNLCVRDADQSC